jgi:uncharacterized repeat protein (TIGR03803 family)
MNLKRPPLNISIRLLCIFVLALSAILKSRDSYAQGKLWGAIGGGLNNAGVIFTYDISTDVLTKKYDFNGTTDGFSPKGGLCLASNGKLYGLTRYKGANNLGVLFEYDITTGAFATKVNFDGTNGSSPRTGLTLGPNGKLYGTTNTGGAHNVGVLFEYDVDLNELHVILDFSNSLGYAPLAKLIVASNGNLYGTTQLGGKYSRGVLFEYNPTLKKYSVVHAFAGGSEGSFAWASVTQGLDGKLYGTMPNGGTGDQGYVFSFDLTTGDYTRIYDFTGSPNGVGPYGGQLTMTPDGKFYGLTDSGPSGSAGPGILYSVTPSTGTFTKEFTFDPFNTETGGTIDMFSNLIYVQNKLYGLTEFGGIFQSGTLFEYDLEKKKYTRLDSFGSVDGSNPSENFLIFIPKADQQISISPLEKTYGDPPFKLEGTTGSGLEITYKSSDSNTASIKGDSVTIHAAGSVQITASQSGDEYWSAAPDSVITLTINKADQIIKFDSIPPVTSADQVIELNATVNTNLPLTYSITSGNDIASMDAIDNSKVLLSGLSGTADITASQEGNNNYKVANATRKLFVDIVMSIDAEHTGGTVAFPNPSSDYLMVHSKNVLMKTLRLHDVSGKVNLIVNAQSPHQHVLNLKSLERGLYLIEITTSSNKIVVLKVMVE